jgi:hypothetical protein
MIKADKEIQNGYLWKKTIYFPFKTTEVKSEEIQVLNCASLKYVIVENYPEFVNYQGFDKTGKFLIHVYDDNHTLSGAQTSLDDVELGFEHLEDDSKRWIMEKGIKFQGNDINLNMLIGGNNNDEILKCVDDTMLEKLIKNESPIEIAKIAENWKTTVNNYYVTRRLLSPKID